MEQNEAVLMESRTLRGSLVGRTETLDKVKALELLPDGLHVTAQMVADYFEVKVTAIRSLVADHRAELGASGYRVLAGQELSAFKALSSFDPRTPSLGVFPRRAVLNVAMLLRDSEVAREVRRWLLDRAEPPSANIGRELEVMVAELVQRAMAPLKEENAALVRQAQRDRELIAELSVRMANTTVEVSTLGGRVDMLCSMLSGPGPGRRRSGRPKR